MSREGEPDVAGQRDVKTRRYVAALDGLRALAILLVVAFHFNLVGVPFRSAGYLGVDIFFVLSGFLITSLLLEAHRRGSVALRSFYVRRACRILPLVGVLLAIGALVVLSSPVRSHLRPGSNLAFVSVASFWSNWYMIWKPGTAGVFTQAWSLAIEIQFYAVWPPLFALLLVWRVRLRYIALVVAALAVTAVLLRLHLWSEAPPAVSSTAPPFAQYVIGVRRGELWRDWYYGSFTHMDGLFVGTLAALALSATRVRAMLTSRAGVRAALLLGAMIGGGSVVIAASRSPLPDFVPVWGLLVLEGCTAVVVACLSLGVGTSVGALLASRPLVWVGRRSYAVYMLHLAALWFVTRFHLTRVVGSAQNHATPWVAVVLTLCAAAASYRFVELPATAFGRRLTASR